MAQAEAWLVRSYLLKRWAKGEGWSITPVGAAALRATFVHTLSGRHQCRQCKRKNLQPAEFRDKRGRRAQRCKQCQFLNLCNRMCP